jgi:hypothetical protein
MKASTRNLLALGLGVALTTPVTFAKGPPTGHTTGNATSASVRTGERPASPTLPTQANANASAAIEGRDSSKDSKATTHQDMSDEAKSPPGKGNWWADTDADADGKISLSEAGANAGLNAKFSVIDTDKDGFVTMDEYRTYFTATAKQGDDDQ